MVPQQPRRRARIKPSQQEKDEVVWDVETWDHMRISRWDERLKVWIPMEREDHDFDDEAVGWTVDMRDRSDWAAFLNALDDDDDDWVDNRPW